ncbi:MAG: hypothetical protein F9K29_22705 [Hyphomicrobiaceae bacterium]|nr:MAG: hypothetical protein F9K29_22705 [Hyphomicrobiaceae bacterium]
MARLTRKMWVGIGAATLVGASVAGSASAQAPAHKSHGAGQAPPAGRGAVGTAAEGGEAYLTDGGPRDTRIRFYRDIALIRGHLLIGSELIALDMWDEALPHFLHPTEELYGLLEKYIKAHKIRPFRLELQALAQAVKARRKGAYEQALKVVDQRLKGALDTARRFMTPGFAGYTARTAAEMLKVALSEYEGSLEDGRVAKPVEYQDSRGFVWEAERMVEEAAPELARTDAVSLAKIRAALAQLKTAWPAPMPPAAPVIEPGKLSALISDIELHASRY